MGNIATLRNNRRNGRIAIPGSGYLEPGETIEFPEDVAMRFADPSVGLVIVKVEADKPQPEFRADADKPRRSRKVKDSE